MKILHVINTLKSGGAEKLVSEIVPRLAESGNQVDVFVFDGRPTYFKSVLEDAGVQVLMYKERCNVYNPLIILKLCRILNDYDIVHTHNTSPQLFGAIASLCSGVKLITTEHSTSNRRRGNSLLSYLDRWMYGRYSKIICISDQTKNNLCDYIPAIEDRVVTIYNGIDLKNYSSDAELPCLETKTDRFIVTMVAGFRYQKDHMTALKAFTHLDKSKYELWFVGDGINREKIESTIVQFGLERNVRLWGLRNDVPSILKLSDVILQSSHIEGFGLAAVEGMAAGKPVVATDVPGLAEVVSGAGILVPPRNDLDLANTIQSLKENHELYEAVGLKCLERSKKFGIEAMVSNYNELYKTI